MITRASQSEVRHLSASEKVPFPLGLSLGLSAESLVPYKFIFASKCPLHVVTQAESKPKKGDTIT